jgi:hypothetical protein
MCPHKGPPVVPGNEPPVTVTKKTTPSRVSDHFKGIYGLQDQHDHALRPPQGGGAIGALLNIVLQPRPLVVLGLNVWMGTAAGADELVEIPTDARA